MALPMLFLVFGLALGRAAMPAAADDGAEPAWRALQSGGHVALMRHATAPGTGDPPGFRLDDCTTQRTLSAEGRAEARRIGAAFRARNVRVAGVWSSQWCRCLETAELLDLAPPVPLPVLNSFFEERGEEAARTAALQAWLAERQPGGTIILVTHQVNITALTGIVPRSGETIVAKPLPGGGLAIVGRIPPR
ncbi:MAG TPA: histidine phosphatase family protein [Rhodospirillales bacterium]|nr:histidine phosphatase family protein [Rhodospirillales bacterium]